MNLLLFVTLLSVLSCIDSFTTSNNIGMRSLNIRKVDSIRVLQNNRRHVLMSTPAELPSSGKPNNLSVRTLARKSIKKLLPLGAMLFFILFNYTILRDTKDVLVVTAPNSGAEIIPFLKTYVNLPSAIGFTILYSNLVMIFIHLFINQYIAIIVQ